MGQIVFNGQKPKYCNLTAITTGSKKDYLIPDGEIWLIDSTNTSKTDGTGKYDYYIKGDGSNTASQLAANKIKVDDSIDISGKADKSEMSVVAGTGANADKTTITLKSGTSATVLTQHQDISGKEDKSNKVTSFSSPTDTQYPSAKLVSDQLATKQGTISDLSTIRSGASAGATAYQKPGTGIPKTDLASAVQTSLGKADTAIQSVTVGTTTTGAAGSSASVTNTGTATAPVLSFTIPQGAQGIQGIQGPQGERGPQGNTGVQVDSVASIIHSIDPTATYAADDVAGADAVQDVLSEVTELEGGVDKTFNEELGNVILGKAIDENGNEVDAEGYLCSKKIPVNPGDTLVYTSGAVATINYCIVLYRADGSKANDYRGTARDRTINVSSSVAVAYCRATFVAGGNYDLKVNGVSSMRKGIKDEIGRLNSEVDALSSNVNTISGNVNTISGNVNTLSGDVAELSEDTQSKIDAIKFNELIGNIIYGKGVNASTGNLVDNEGVFMTDKIPAAEGDVIVYHAGKSLTGDSLGFVAFNSSDVRLTGASGLVGDREYTMPANTAYIRATFAKGYANIKLTKNGVNVIINGLVDNTIYLSQFNRDKIELLNLLSNNKLGNIIEGIGINGDDDVVYEDSDLVSTMLIPASEGQHVNYLAGASISPASLVVYDHNGIKIKYWNGTLSVRSLDMPANTAYIAASFKKGTNYSLTIDRGDGEGYVNVLNEGEIRSNLIIGKAVYSDGSIVMDADMVATEKIRCQYGDAVIYKGGSAILSTNQYSLVAYDASDVKISNWRGSASERSFPIPNNTAYIRATFAIGTDFSLTINGKDVIFNKELNNIILKDAEQDKRLDLLELSASDRGHLMPINAFGDILPAAFKAKYMSMENDLLIACQGDSLTGLIEKCDAQEEPEHCPPGCQYKSWIYLLQQNLSKKKPVCDRVDSQRDNVDVFTKTGTWENVVEIERTEIYARDGTTYGQQRTISALTFQCADNNAALSFEFDADVYEKCNIVYSKEPDGVLTKIVISEGDGKMLVSEDRTTWVEANNYQCSQRTFDEVTETGGNANRECHRRLWMKKASGNVSGVLHITYQRDNSTQYADSYMYVWGIEKWSDCAVFIDNLGRGGRTTKILKANISDIFDRHPDLAIYEMPLANEISTEGTCQTRATLKGSDYYGGYFLGNGNDSFKTRSNNYADLPLIIILPHGRANYFDDNNNAVRLANSPDGEPNVYTCAKQMYTWLKGQLSNYTAVTFVNLYDVLISEALVLDDKINRGFYGAAKAITADGTENSVHLSQYGAYLWAKYLTGMFLMD